MVARRYHFPNSSGSANDLVAQIDHNGTAFWFPLGTSDAEAAAAKALRIYQAVEQQGWKTCCRRFSRELTIGFEWSPNPLLWTYTTIYTLAGNARPAVEPHIRNSRLQRVLIAEPDAGVRRALEWSVNQHPGFGGIGCDTATAFLSAMKAQSADLALVNRNQAECAGLNSPGRVESARPIPIVTYSVAADGDHLFVSTPGGAAGYLFRRVKPERVLEPILDAAGRAVPADEMLPRVKAYFKTLLQPRPAGVDPGLSRLTRRENEVLALLSKGRADKEIAQALGISAWTVHGHIKSIFGRLGVRTRTGAVVRYLEK